MGGSDAGKDSSTIVGRNLNGKGHGFVTVMVVSWMVMVVFISPEAIRIDQLTHIFSAVVKWRWTDGVHAARKSSQDIFSDGVLN